MPRMRAASAISSRRTAAMSRSARVVSPNDGLSRVPASPPVHVTTMTSAPAAA